MSSSLLSRRIHTRCIPLTRTLVTSLPPKVLRPGRFGFALDIDGVLLRGPEPHPSAKKALTKLQQNDIPFILLTNGGGLSEAARCEDLSSKLDFPIAPSQLVQSHTPAKNYIQSYETILVVGGEGENCRKIAEEYGFKNVFIPDDFYATDPDISPFSTSPPPAYARNVPEGTKIDAIFVFNDPRDWALSTQLIIDLLHSDNGVYGTVAKPGLRKPVPTFFTNIDMVWASQYHIPRLGQGAFREAVLSIFPRIPGARGGAYLRTLGKPTLPTFRYAQRLMVRSLVAKLGATSPDLKTRILERVYMIGDNPESDIRGANRSRPDGTVWWSILVRSGVWREPHNTKSPMAIVDDVLAAVDWAMGNEQKIKDGVALEVYPGTPPRGFRQMYRKPRVKSSSPDSGGKVEVADMEGEKRARIEKADSAMKEMRSSGVLGKRRSNGESGSDSD
ncbi:HAD-like domain-containing protein [Tuber brumale]|nr:HAD-like domain-containing protein [Tuber brumale]